MKTKKIESRQFFFILSSRAASQPALMQFIQSENYGYSKADFASEPFIASWNRAADKGRPVLFIDYPVTEEADIETAKSFLSHTIAEEGAWYYSPRPNSLLAVKNAFLLGVKHPSRIGRLNKRFLWSLLRGGYHISQKILPAFLAMSVRTFARNVLRKHSSLSGTEIHAPDQKVHPAGLAFYGACEWQAWNPEHTVFRRDLLERADWFFPHPTGMHVIVSNQCNLKCTHCPYHSPKYRAEHTSGYFNETIAMTAAVFEKIAQYAARKNVDLQFGQIEEAMTHERLIDFIRYAKSIGVPRVHLTTNGTLLDERQADRLAESGVDSVMFSIDSITPETYKKIRGANLEKLERNIEYFTRKARKKDINLMASFILQKPALQERDAFLRKWRERGFNQVTFYVLTEHDPRTGAMFRGQELYDKGERYPCASPWTQMVVFPGGEVSLCCKTMTDVGWRGIISVGTIPAEEPEEIWAGKSGKGFYRVRKELLDNHFAEYKVCTNCPIWSASTSIVERTEKYTRAYNETMETYTFE